MTKKKDKDDGDLGASEVQDKVDAAEDKGHVGNAPDPTPNANYTVSGVTSGKPTPETDADAKAEARDMLDRGTDGTTRKK